MFDKYDKRPVFLLLLMVSLLFTVPVLAHGDDPDEEESTAEVADDHGEEDAHDEGLSNVSVVIGGIAGAALLAIGAAYLFSPRPDLISLIGLALIGGTGIIHLMVGLTWSDMLLILNAIGYIGLGIVWVMPKQFFPNQRRILAAVLALYTLATIFGYFLTHDHFDFVGLMAKVIEFPLFLILAYDAFRSTANA